MRPHCREESAQCYEAVVEVHDGRPSAKVKVPLPPDRQPLIPTGHTGAQATLHHITDFRPTLEMRVQVYGSSLDAHADGMYHAAKRDDTSGNHPRVVFYRRQLKLEVDVAAARAARVARAEGRGGRLNHDDFKKLSTVDKAWQLEATVLDMHTTRWQLRRRVQGANKSHKYVTEFHAVCRNTNEHSLLGRSDLGSAKLGEFTKNRQIGEILNFPACDQRMVARSVHTFSSVMADRVPEREAYDWAQQAYKHLNARRAMRSKRCRVVAAALCGVESNIDDVLAPAGTTVSPWFAGVSGDVADAITLPSSNIGAWYGPGRCV